MPLIILRSALFHAVFYPYCTFWFVAAIVTWPFPNVVLMWFARAWAAGAVYLHELITGATVEIRGAENVPEGSILVAAKHQSAWETMALVLFVPKPTYILKRELLSIPLFGWHLRKAQQIPIDRAQKSQAMAAVAGGTQRAIARGRQILIFPEGTRKKVGAEPGYRMGVARVYAAANIPCVPVAMTSGLAWPRNTLLHFPRRILVEFLPAIPPGLPQEAFFEKLQAEIEGATNRLLAEAGYVPAKAGLSQASA